MSTDRVEGQTRTDFVERTDGNAQHYCRTNSPSLFLRFGCWRIFPVKTGERENENKHQQNIWNRQQFKEACHSYHSPHQISLSHSLTFHYHSSERSLSNVLMSTFQTCVFNTLRIISKDFVRIYWNVKKPVWRKFFVSFYFILQKRLDFLWILRGLYSKDLLSNAMDFLTRYFPEFLCFVFVQVSQCVCLSFIQVHGRFHIIRISKILHTELNSMYESKYSKMNFSQVERERERVAVAVMRSESVFVDTFQLIDINWVLYVHMIEHADE